MSTTTANMYGFTPTDAATANADEDTQALLWLCRSDDPKDVCAAIRTRETALASGSLTPAQRTAAYLRVTEAAYARLAVLGAEGPTKLETRRVKNPALQG